MSASSPPNGGGNKGRLTDNQKKQNHIVSEQKRRQAIREGFDQLADLVPGMQGQGRSEATVLQATVAYLRKLLEKKAELRRIALARGMSEQEFESRYTGAERSAQLAEEEEEVDEGGYGGR